jgi:exodeoxyribonuclease VII large subunit
MALRFYRSEQLDQRMMAIITAWQYQLANASDGLESAMRLSLSQRQSVLGKAAGALETVNPKARLRGEREVISSVRTLLEAAMRTRLAGLQETIRFEKDRLEALNPLAIWARGFSVTTDERGNIITHAATLAAGQHIGIRFQDGKRKAVVEE